MHLELTLVNGTRVTVYDAEAHDPAGHGPIEDLDHALSFMLDHESNGLVRGRTADGRPFVVRAVAITAISPATDRYVTPQFPFVETKGA